MDKGKIIGRIEECERLKECMDADSAQLIIVYGRRRVGKTYLINNYFDDSFAFKITGAYGVGRETQLRNFFNSIKRKAGDVFDPPKDWVDAFDILRDYLESLPADEKQVVFFDEMPWLDTQKSGFLSAFEWFWNDWASTRANLVFIVCGSATSWMDEKIANNKGGLFNRQTCKIYLKPFKLYEVKEYLEARSINWSNYDIVLCYMVMGGIPYYLSLLKRKLSLTQNIDMLFFYENGELRDEFDHLYRSLFTNSDSYIKVVEALSSAGNGLIRSEIAEKTSLYTNGDLSKILKDLVMSGFVRESGFYNRKKKETRYQLCDFYSAFYFRFIKGKSGHDHNFWSNTLDNPSRKVWEGLTFEQVCLDHVPQIKRSLGIAGVLSTQSTWFTSENKELKLPGAQIDLLIDRRDNVISVCEIKFSRGEYSIDKEYDLKLRNKIETFRSATKTKKTIQIVMVTTYGVKENKYASAIQNQVVMDELFTC